VTGCDLLVLAAPLDATLGLIGRLHGLSRLPTLTLDVASVKLPVVGAAAGLTGFVATHPIAGSERTGPAAANASLFEGKTWAYDASAAPGDAARAEAFIGEMGARPFAVEAGRHDRILALTSHLPQLLSVALGAQLARRLDEPGVEELCGTGMASMLRLAGSAWSVWRPIFDQNGGAVAQEVRQLTAILLDAAADLEADPARLETLFAAASEAAVPAAREHPTRLER
jgi:prephenate dehydrogenase